MFLVNYLLLGGLMLPIRILKRLVSVFINACRLLSALPSLSQFGPGRLSLVAISFYVLSLLFGPCRLSEFTLAGPLLMIILKGNTYHFINSFQSFNSLFIICLDFLLFLIDLDHLLLQFSDSVL